MHKALYAGAKMPAYNLFPGHNITAAGGKLYNVTWVCIASH